MINKRFIAGFAFNRKHFHTSSDACLLCVLWSNEDASLDSFSVKGWDIKNNALVSCGELDIKRIRSLYSEHYCDKRTFQDDQEGGILSCNNGEEYIPETEKMQKKKRVCLITNENIIGYLVVQGSNFDNPDMCVHLTRGGFWGGNGFYLRKDCYLEKLPMFCAGRYVNYNRKWTERARVMKSADRADCYHADLKKGKLDNWLLKCLLFTCLERKNHLLTFTGSDGRLYRNELCLDTTHGETIASHDLKQMNPNDREKKLFKQWDQLMKYAKRASQYCREKTYGVYQISKEIDLSYKDKNSKKTIWENINVHSTLETLRELLKEYYNEEIVPTLLTYEFLK